MINKPTQTMIDHLVSQNTKLTLYFLLNFLSVIVASYVSFRAVIFFSGYIFTMWIYSHRIKKLLLWGNFISATSSYHTFLRSFRVLSQFRSCYFLHTPYSFSCWFLPKNLLKICKTSKAISLITTLQFLWSMANVLLKNLLPPRSYFAYYLFTSYFIASLYSN